MVPRGFTIIELLAALTILALLTTLALPSAQRLFNEIQAETTIHALRGGIALARAAAATQGRPALLCPLDADDRCSGNWNEGFSVFMDLGQGAERHPAAPVLRHFGPSPRGASLRFAAFGSTRHLRMLPTGQTNWQNGRFEYCPPPGSRAEPRVLVINVQGRSRLLRPEHLDRSSGPRRRVVC